MWTDILEAIGIDTTALADLLPDWLVNFTLSDLTSLLPETWTNLTFSDLLPTALQFVSDTAVSTVTFFANSSLSDFLPDWLKNFSLSDLTSLLPEAWMNLSFMDILPNALRLAEIATNHPVAFADFVLERFLPDSIKNFTLENLLNFLPESWKNFIFDDILPTGIKDFTILDLPEAVANLDLGSLIPDAIKNFSTQTIADLLPQSFKDFSLEKLLDETQIGDESLGDKIADILDFSIPGTDATGADVFDGIVEGIDKVKDAFVFTLENPFESIDMVIQGISDAFSTISEVYGSISESFRNELPSPIGEPLAVVANGIAAAFETISRLIETIRTAFQGELNNPFEAIKNSLKPITDFFDTIESNLKKLQEAFTSIELPTIPGLSQLKDAGDAISGFFGGEEEVSLEVEPEVKLDTSNIDVDADALIKSFEEAYEENAGLAVTDFAAINKKLVEDGFTAADIEAAAKAAGLEVPAGLAAGLADEDQVLDRAARKLPTNILLALKEELGIESPSTVASQEVGVPIGEGVIEGMITALSGASERIRMALQTLLGGLTTASDGSTLGTFLNVSQQISAFVQFREMAVAELEDMVRDYVDMLEDLNENGFKEIRDFVDDSVDKLGEFIEFIEDDVIDSIDALLRSLATLKSKGTSEIRSFVSKAEAELKKLRDVFREVGEQAVDELLRQLRNLGSRAVTVINSQVASIRANLGTGPGSTFGMLGQALGKDMADGIVDGIGTLSGDLTRALNSEIRKALDRVRQSIGAASPARLFTEGLGEPIGEGVTGGAEELVDGLADSISDSLGDTVRDVSRDLRQSFRRLDRAYQSIRRSFGREIPNPIPTSLISDFNQVIDLLTTDINTPLASFDSSIQSIDNSLASLEGSIEGLIDRLEDLGDALSNVGDNGGQDIVVGPITQITAASLPEIELPVTASFVLDEDAIQAQAEGLALQVSRSLDVSIADNLQTENIGANFGPLLTSANANEVLAAGASVADDFVGSLRTNLQEANVSDVINSAVQSADATMDTLESLQEFNELGSEAIEEFVTIALEQFNLFVEFILGDFIDALIELIENLEDMVERGETAIENFVAAAETELRRLIDVFETVGGQAVDALVNALDSLSSRVVSEIRNQVNQIVDELQADVDNPVNAPFYVLGDRLGDQLADGIVAGIEGSAFGITNAIVNEVREAIRDAQVRLGIASPSKFSATELGVPVGARYTKWCWSNS